eukprot:TRINITY_DN33529_c0_g1_i1.p1 TRINITY_DN33529_c0_g1~~TRINITY_DN33529_c0_g1_i1.p1  ORF type:complete len:164 (+),score=6.77 TRINITY_DN33529_c0_g1_i1:30-521(+)
MFRIVARRAYSASRMVRAAETAAVEGDLIVNFSTPHEPIVSKKVVDMITLPGESGVYAITKGHAPTISQLQPGVVSITNVGGDVENYFIPGGYALTHENNTTDITTPEAYALTDLDENAIKTALANAQKALSTEAEGSEGKQVAQIEVDTLSAMGRALGMTGV